MVKRLFTYRFDSKSDYYKTVCHPLNEAKLLSFIDGSSKCLVNRDRIKKLICTVPDCAGQRKMTRGLVMVNVETLAGL